MKIKCIGLLAFVGLLAPHVSSATVVTYTYDATVTSIQRDGDGPYPSQLPNAGSGLIVRQTIHGQFTYDTSAPAADAGDGILTIVFPAATVSGSSGVTVSNGTSDSLDFSGPFTDVIGAGGIHGSTASRLSLVDSSGSAFNSSLLSHKPRSVRIQQQNS